MKLEMEELNNEVTIVEQQVNKPQYFIDNKVD